MNSQSIKNYINVFQSIVILLSWSRSLFCFDYFLTSLFYFPDQVHYEGITLVIILRASKLHMNTWSITYKNVNLKKKETRKHLNRNKKNIYHVAKTVAPCYFYSSSTIREKWLYTELFLCRIFLISTI